ncbi:GNAT family N-acetyltransferase [Cellulomonas sp. HZM]|uniref:GNAT family N-acetyltransferase n=1 Tax=Cellulomonas sp. HZM TaxID=1454010 RepID=UPI0004936CA7|nr:GNAT family N-acetyltransferase [Cellulomonas sp. HZM]
MSSSPAPSGGRARPAPPDVVVRLDPRDRPAAARVLAAALADDPGFRHIFPVDRRREKELRALYRMTLADALRHGTVFATRLDGQITGVAALYAPGTYPMTTGRWWRQAGRILGLAVRTRTHAVRLMKFGDLTSGGVPSDSWYVEALGVRPDLQLEGRGKLLMQHVFAAVDEHSDPGYLETTKPLNVAYYAALGYALVHERVPLAADGPWIFPMARPAVASAA